MFRHYILTRMNLGIYSRNDAKQWMKARMALFDRYLFPSVMNQTCKKFKWVLCFDERTPDEVVCRYDYCDNIQIAWGQPKNVVPTFEPEENWLITSRIDNDDFYFPEFVQTIQNRFEPYPQVIDIDYYQWDNRKGKGGVYSSGRPTPNSPFISLIEPWCQPKGVYQMEHSNMPKYFAATKVDKALAVQMVHGSNILNKIRGVYIPNVIIKDCSGCYPA